jgi:hypothetical protein
LSAAANQSNIPNKAAFFACEVGLAKVALQRYFQIDLIASCDENNAGFSIRTTGARRKDGNYKCNVGG